MTQKKNVTWFVILAVVLSWPLFLLPLVRPDSMLATWPLAMFGPGLAAIIVTRFVARESLSSLNLRRLGPKRLYLWAWLTPPVLAVVALGFTLLLGLGEFDTSFSFIMAALPEGVTAVPPWLIALGQLLFVVVVAPLVNVLGGSMGEELGWRGFLLPRLLELGKWRAILLSNVVWGLWHVPVILQGHNYPEHPVLGIFLMVVFCMLLGIFLSWLYLETRSPWAPALAHGAVNASAGLPMVVLVPGVNMTLGGTLASLAGWIGLALFAAWLIASGRLPLPGRGLSQS